MLTLFNEGGELREDALAALQQFGDPEIGAALLAVMSEAGALKAKIATLEAGGRADSESLPFGDPRIDGCFLGDGLPLGCWHEFGAQGMEAETAACPAAFAALVAAPLAKRGEAVWNGRLPQPVLCVSATTPSTLGKSASGL